MSSLYLTTSDAYLRTSSETKYFHLVLDIQRKYILLHHLPEGFTAALCILNFTFLINLLFFIQQHLFLEVQ